MNGHQAVEALNNQILSAPDHRGTIEFRGNSQVITDKLSQFVAYCDVPGITSEQTQLRITQEALQTHGAIMAVFLDHVAAGGVIIENLGMRILCRPPLQSSEAVQGDAIQSLVACFADLTKRM
jgi:hypothetical protein